MKRIRHCVKRDFKGCKGKGGRNFCTNAGEMDWKVRDSGQGLVGMRGNDPHCFANRIWGWGLYDDMLFRRLDGHRPAVSLFGLTP